MSKKMTAPKGTRDFLPGFMETRKKITDTIEKIFRTYGYYSWDGPAFEYLETVTQKSGDEVSNEIYVFSDKGGRDLALRFELTTTIARMIAGNPVLKKPVKSYSVGKVWRYEKPQQGRYREFLQMDADAFGAESMLAEVELLALARDVLEKIGFGNYYILLNNRKILEALVRCAGINQEKKDDVLKAFDKIQKIGAEGVKKEFIERGLTEEDFENFSKLIVKSDSNGEKILEMKELLKNDEKGIEGLEELSQILEFAKQINLDDKINVDFTLVRGLDYYTGPIFEIKISEGEQVGSISGGGRYDNLIEMFGGQPTPAIGISFGIERIIDLIENSPALSQRFKAETPEILVIYMDTKLVGNAFEIVQKLRDAGISADIDLSMRAFQKQMKYANSKEYPYILLVGEDEIKNGKYTLKEMKTGEQSHLSVQEIIDRKNQAA